jgi:hypothetical protein
VVEIESGKQSTRPQLAIAWRSGEVIGRPC